MICRVCESDLPDDSFNWRKAGVSRHHICRTCKVADRRAWYETHREQHIAASARATVRTRARQRALLQRVKDRPCADCGQQYPYYVMQFDHLGDKDFTIAAKIGAFSDEKLLAEVAKCDVVCSNCHCERSHKRRQTI